MEQATAATKDKTAHRIFAASVAVVLVYTAAGFFARAEIADRARNLSEEIISVCIRNGYSISNAEVVVKDPTLFRRFIETAKQKIPAGDFLKVKMCLSDYNFAVRRFGWLPFCAYSVLPEEL